MNKISCRFEFECSKKWPDLTATDNENVKFCSSCNHEVYLVKSQSEFDQYAANGKCVAIEELEWAMLGVPEGTEFIEYSLYIFAQDISGKKLKSIRDVLMPGLSLSEARLMFHSKPVKIENLAKAYAEDAQSSLARLGIRAEVQGRKIA